MIIEERHIAVYCRVSTDEQARDGVSLDEQNARLRAYCQAMGWAGTVTAFVDDGYSAKSLQRPALQALLDEVEQGRIGKLMVTKLDRLSRRLIDLLTLIERLQTHGVSFVSTSESFDTDTPSGRLTLQVLGAVAEFERERIRERVIDNMAHAARSGKWLTQHPYGYRLEEKLLVVHKDEAAVVARVFRWFVDEGLGYFAIAKRLNANGVPSRQNRQWSVRAVKLLLSNPVYIGTLVWNRVDTSGSKRVMRDREDWIEIPNAAPAIVAQDVWQRAQARVCAQPSRAPRAQSSPHLLSGIVKCGACGAPMSIGWSGYPKRRRVYRCSAYKNKGTCRSQPYGADDVEAWVLDGLDRLISPLDRSTHEIKLPTEFPDGKSAAQKAVQSAKLRYERKVEAYAAGLIDLDTLAREKRALDEVQRVSDSSAGDQAQRIGGLQQLAQDLRDRAVNVPSALAELPVDVAKAKLRTLVSEVVVHGAADIEIVLKSVQSPLDNSSK